MRGVFITFEGGDGAGKTTQLQLLAAALSERGYTVVQTREPGGTMLGTQIRELLLHGGAVSPRAEALLYAADRAQHVASVIRPGLEAGAVVLSDRYIDSSLAYQGGARELGAGIRAISEWATEELWPDLTVLLDIPENEGLARADDGHYDRIEAEGREFHRAVRENFLALAADNPQRYLVLNARETVAELAAQISARVETLLAGLENLAGMESVEGQADRGASQPVAGEAS
ncbi:dTMP kinase [Actinotignum schaalii]|uniref:dTMP kinase n=1 Tax=Actinotignum schaalii TaxID=59505 RepID=UPI0004237DA6|nr:dTMP kinase [Actinotignum schaalii]AIE82761.1 thymidylate kinase [Actinotignum schaalii]WQN44867.1 dTMP kinase [Actinotignum schaalii]